MAHDKNVKSWTTLKKYFRFSKCLLSFGFGCCKKMHVKKIQCQGLHQFCFMGITKNRNTRSNKTKEKELDVV